MLYTPKTVLSTCGGPPTYFRLRRATFCFACGSDIARLRLAHGRCFPSTVDPVHIFACGGRRSASPARSDIALWRLAQGRRFPPGVEPSWSPAASSFGLYRQKTPWPSNVWISLLLFKEDVRPVAALISFASFQKKTLGYRRADEARCLKARAAPAAPSG